MMAVAIKVRRRPVQCQNCRFYPDDCGYWDKSYRDSHPQASFLAVYARHGCQDYERRPA